MSIDPSRLQLQGARVCIRPWQHRDLLVQESWPRFTEPFSGLWNTPRSMSNGGRYGRSYTRSSSVNHIWAVEDHQAELIGRISLREIEQYARRARLGISLGSPYVSKGLGTEALLLFLQYYFGPMDFRVMLLDVAAFNQRAVRCYEHLGFREVGSDWRRVGYDPALRLLDEPVYSDLRPFFRRDRYDTWVQFFEMELHRSQWLTKVISLKRSEA